MVVGVNLFYKVLDKLPFKINLNIGLGNIHIIYIILIVSVSYPSYPYWQYEELILYLYFLIAEQLFSKKTSIKARAGKFTQM